ncbi:MAG: hypothetical protein L6406_25480 [Desulfobacterales bacterium]|nr:hypothetical protein [Desulfobacterales bacterium]
MKCAICGIEIDSVDEGIDDGWIPYVWEGDHEQDGPFCSSCSEILIQIDKDGEYVVKEEYRGKITYQEGDFFENEQDEYLSAGIVLEYCEN